MVRPHFRLAIVRAVGRDKRLIKQRYRQPAPRLTNRSGHA
jgi:hypothetical protein